MIQTNKQQKSVNSKYWQNKAQNPIVKGYFPRYKSYKEMAIAKVNRFLFGLLGVSVLVSFICFNEFSIKNSGFFFGGIL